MCSVKRKKKVTWFKKWHNSLHNAKKKVTRKNTLRRLEKIVLMNLKPEILFNFCPETVKTILSYSFQYRNNYQTWLQTLVKYNAEIYSIKLSYEPLHVTVNAHWINIIYVRLGVFDTFPRGRYWTVQHLSLIHI